MSSMFNKCTELTDLNISGFTTTSATVMKTMLSNSNKLERLTLGPDFVFSSDSGLTVAANGNTSTDYTHRWTLEDPYDSKHARTNYELMNTYDGEVEASTWVWEKTTCSLLITNTVSGNMGSKAKEFTFTLSFPSIFTNTELTAIDTNGDNVIIPISEKGEGTFVLKHGESIEIIGLTPDQLTAIQALSSLGVLEGDYSSEGYKTSSTISTPSTSQSRIDFLNENSAILPTGINDGRGVTAFLCVLGVVMLCLRRVLTDGFEGY